MKRLPSTLRPCPIQLEPSFSEGGVESVGLSSVPVVLKYVLHPGSGMYPLSARPTARLSQGVF